MTGKEDGLMTTLVIVGVLAVVALLTWLYERRHSRIFYAALASVAWHEDKSEWQVTYDGVRWYVETKRHDGKPDPGDLGRARAFPFGYQASPDFELKLHRIIELHREQGVAKEWRAQHGVVLEQDK